MNLLERLNEFFSKLGNDSAFLISFILSIIVLSALYYYITKILVDNKAEILILIFSIAMLIFAGVFLTNDVVPCYLYAIIPLTIVIAVLVLFSVEIKRVIWSGKKMKYTDIISDTNIDEDKINNCIEQIVKALQDMSKNDVGAIIVLSNGNVPYQILDSGVKMDCEISSELIESVFFPKTPLHDGAMVIDGVRIKASGCFLPLPQNSDAIPKELGTRHRAGLGITENIDVVSLIVSEETGIITVAKEGKLTRYADAGMLKKVLNEYYWSDRGGEIDNG